jgi:hypothetical protein
LRWYFVIAPLQTHSHLVQVVVVVTAVAVVVIVVVVAHTEHHRQTHNQSWRLRYRKFLIRGL